MRLKANTQYTVSAFVKGSAALATGYDNTLHIQSWCDEDNSTFSSLHQETAGTYDTAVTTSWKRIYQTFTTPSSANLTYCRFYFYPLVAGFTLNIAYVKLEEGNVPTDWVINVEDAAALVESARSSAVSTAAGDATTKAATKLNKSAADILTGPITINTGGAIVVGTINSSTGLPNNGVILGPSGLVGRKNSVNTFSIATDGTATFAGAIEGATFSTSSGRFSVDSNGYMSATQGLFNGYITAQSFTTIGGKFTAQSDGTVIADLVDIRRRTVLEYGTVDPVEVISGVSSAGNDKIVTYYPAGKVFRGQINQVVYTVNLPPDLTTYNSSGNQPYYVAAYFNGSIRSWTGSSGSTYDFFLRAHAVPVRTYSNSGAYSNDGKVSMIFDYAMVLTSGTFTSFRLPTATWIIYKL